LGEDSGSFGACFRDDFIPGIIAEGKKRCEAGNRGCVRCARATLDDGGEVYLGTGPVLVEGGCERCIFFADDECGVREVVVCTVYPCPVLEFFIEE
jgi:hypothetical protein